MQLLHYIVLICGLIIGMFLAFIFNRTQTSCGTLRIDHSNPEKDVYRFDVDDLDKLSKKKRIILKVDNNADLSQK